MPVIESKQFNGGVNLEDFAGDLANNEIREGINVLISKRGSLKKREGSAEYGSDAAENAVYALKKYTDSDGNYKEFKAISTKVVEYNTGAWDTEIKAGLTAGLYMKMSNIKCPAVAADDTGTADATSDSYYLDDDAKAWTVNEYRDYVVKILTGTGAGQVKTILENTATRLYVDGRWDVTPDVTSTYSIHAIVKAVICNNGTNTPFKIIGETATDVSTDLKFTDQVTHHGRLWGIRGSKVYFTGIANGEQIDGYANIDTGEDLIGIGRAGDDVVVYSKTKSGIIIGNDPDTIVFRWRENTHGCISKVSIASWGKYSIALAQEGVYAFDGSTDYLLSRKITPAISVIKGSLKDESFGFVFDDLYYLLHAVNSSSSVKDTMWVMDLVWSSIPNEDGVWTSHEGINCNVMGVFKDANDIDYLVIGKSDNSKVLELYDGTYNDSDSSIKFSVKTKEYSAGSVGAVKKLGVLYYEGQSQSSVSDLQVYKNLNGDGFELITTISNLQAGGLWDAGLFDVAVFGGSDRIITRMRPGGRGRTIQYQFYNNLADQAIEMYLFEQNFDYHRIH